MAGAVNRNMYDKGSWAPWNEQSLHQLGMAYPPCNTPRQFPGKSLDPFGQDACTTPRELVARNTAFTATGPPASRRSKGGKEHLA